MSDKILKQDMEDLQVIISNLTTYYSSGPVVFCIDPICESLLQVYQRLVSLQATNLLNARYNLKLYYP